MSIRGSSGRVTPLRTSTVAKPPRFPIMMSVSMRSPTITDSDAGTPSAASATSRMMGEGFPIHFNWLKLGETEPE